MFSESSRRRHRNLRPLAIWEETFVWDPPGKPLSYCRYKDSELQLGGGVIVLSHLTGPFSHRRPPTARPLPLLGDLCHLRSDGRLTDKAVRVRWT